MKKISLDPSLLTLTVMNIECITTKNRYLIAGQFQQLLHQLLIEAGPDEVGIISCNENLHEATFSMLFREWGCFSNIRQKLALNKSCPIEIQRIIAKDVSSTISSKQVVPEEGYNLARYSVHPEILAEVSAVFNYALALELVKNKHATTSILRALVLDAWNANHLDVLRKLATQNHAVDAEVLEYMLSLIGFQPTSVESSFDEESLEFVKACFQNAGVSQEMLARYFESKSRFIRKLVARKITDEGLLEALVMTGDNGVLLQLSRNRSVTSELLEKVFDRLEFEPQVEPTGLIPESHIYSALASHMNISKECQLLLLDKGLYGYELLQNSNCDGAVLWKLFSNHAFRDSALKHPNFPVARILELLASDSFEFTESQLVSIASRVTNVSPELFEMLSKSRKIKVRLAIAENLVAPKSVLLRLSKQKNSVIREAAEKTLSMIS